MKQRVKKSIPLLLPIIGLICMAWLYSKSSPIVKQTELFTHVLIEVVELRVQDTIQVTVQKPGGTKSYVLTFNEEDCPYWQSIELGSEWYLVITENADGTAASVGLPPFCSPINEG